MQPFQQAAEVATATCQGAFYWVGLAIRLASMEPRQRKVTRYPLPSKPWDGIAPALHPDEVANLARYRTMSKDFIMLKSADSIGLYVDAENARSESR